MHACHTAPCTNLDWDASRALQLLRAGSSLGLTLSFDLLSPHSTRLQLLSHATTLRTAGACGIACLYDNCLCTVLNLVGTQLAATEAPRPACFALQHAGSCDLCSFVNLISNSGPARERDLCYWADRKQHLTAYACDQPNTSNAWSWRTCTRARARSALAVQLRVLARDNETSQIRSNECALVSTSRPYSSPAGGSFDLCRIQAEASS
jgi:hypothetical protein